MREAVAEDLTKNGLELEAASLTQLDQTGMEFFNPSNAFDAEGLTRLTEQIEHRKKQRNDVEQDTLIAIRNKNLEAEKLSLEIDRESEYARLSQQREVEIARARQRAELATERAQREQDGESAQIAAQADDRRGAHPLRADARAGAHRQGARDPGAPRSNAARRWSWPSSSAPSRSRARARRRARRRPRPTRRAPQAVSAEEKVFTAREVEMAERKKAIELIGAAQAAEREALRLTSAAQAEKAASADRGAAIRAQAEADADADKIKSMAMRVRAEIEAEALRLMNEAHNMLTPEARAVGAAHEAGREGRGDHPRVGAADGAHRGHQDPAGRRPRRRRRRRTATASGGGNFADSVVNSALRFRAQAPLVDQLLREIGLEGGDIQRLVGGASGGAGGAAAGGRTDKKE